MSEQSAGAQRAEAAVRAVEALRCAALGRGDLAALASLLDHDYLHVHGNGRVTDKAATLDRLGSAPRRVERIDLTVRVWEDTALLVGEQVNRSVDASGGERLARGRVTQVLRRRGAAWVFVSFQFTSVE